LSNFFDAGELPPDNATFVVGPQEPVRQAPLSVQPVAKIVQADADDLLFRPNVGLVDKKKGYSAPLRGALIDVKIAQFVADTSAKLRFTNQNDNPMEATFVR
jgi:hypothetical protein